jgi:glycosyltransferase involved in cell wall biosynthesis
MRVGVLTSLYPSAARPHEGIFAERRWIGMGARGHAVRVVQPLPLVPPLANVVGPERWRDVAASPAREERGGVPIVRPRYLHLPGRARGNARRFARAGVRALLAPAATGPPEVVICDYAWPASAAAPALAERGVPCVVNGRGSDVLQVAGEGGLAEELGRNLRAAGRWCAVSRDLALAMDRAAGAPGRGVLVPNGVDLEHFRPGDRDAARRALDLAPDGALVLVVGHLIARKDPLLALAAFRAAGVAGARIAFVGRGELECDLRAAADERVVLAGEVPPERLATWYAASDALLLTSSREGRPNVVLEALASGRPVVATRVGGTAELLAAAPGMLVDAREPAAVGVALAALLAAPPSPADCRALVAHLTWDASLDALERLLAEAAA